MRAETTRLNDARTRLAGLQELKRQSLAERQAELVQIRQAATDITKSVSDLGDLISKLDKEVARKQGSAPTSRKSRQSPPQTGAAPAGPSRPQLSGNDRSPSVVLAPSRRPRGHADARPHQASHAVPGRQGPAAVAGAGRRVLTFGEKTQYGSQSKGVVLETRHGGQVVSPSDGWIVYAGEFRSYGQLLIINAGGGYHILLAGLSQIDVQLGQFVLAGEPVGVMSAAAKSSPAKAQDNAPILYIEFRKDQRPIDPDPWWSDASRKVQGNDAQIGLRILDVRHAGLPRGATTVLNVTPDLFRHLDQLGDLQAARSVRRRARARAQRLRRQARRRHADRLGHQRHARRARSALGLSQPRRTSATCRCRRAASSVASASR